MTKDWTIDKPGDGYPRGVQNVQFRAVIFTKLHALSACLSGCLLLACSCAVIFVKKIIVFCEAMLLNS